jgi:hypothetical protein
LAVEPFAAPPRTHPDLPSSVVASYPYDTSGTVIDHGRRLAISFVGAPAGDQPCDAAYDLQLFASRTAVAFAIMEKPVPVPAGHACTAVGVHRRATARLTAPLGERVLVAAADAEAIPVS